MASYDNLMTMEPWAFRSTLTDNWFSDVFARETEALTKALQKSLANHESPILPNNNNADTFSPFFNLENVPVHTPTASGPTVSGGSENDISAAVSKRTGNIGGVANRKIAKRKARASKRASTTTYITADAANFRQMVQQVTGIRIGGGGVNGHVSVAAAAAAPVLKPEAQRMVVNRLQQHGGNCLPTLDTSAFLLEQQQQQQMVDPATTSFMSSISHQTPSAVVDGGSSGFDFETYSSFPTLESWN